MQEQANLGGLMGEVPMEDASKEGEQEMFLDHQECCNKTLQLSLHSMGVSPPRNPSSYDDTLETVRSLCWLIVEPLIDI